MKVLSCGGGLNSWAMLLDAVDRGELPDVVTFVDVGDRTRPELPGEWPGTYQHVEESVAGVCRQHGIELVIIDGHNYPVRDSGSLFEWMDARQQIPVAGPNRICTIVAKVERFERWLDDRFPDQDVEVWIGFDAGEPDRVLKDPNAGKPRRHKPGQARRHNRFPLIERELCRCRCERLAREAEVTRGYPVPRKSACVFCPYASKKDWQTLARDRPDLFAEAVRLEAQKPPTAKNGRKLSIMAYRSARQRADGSWTEPKPTPLPIYVAGKHRPRAPEICTVCRAGFKATKATGCGPLTTAEYC